MTVYDDDCSAGHRRAIITHVVSSAVARVYTMHLWWMRPHRGGAWRGDVGSVLSLTRAARQVLAPTPDSLAAAGAES